MATRSKDEQVGNYRLIRYINSGGESEVWEAKPLGQEKAESVAIKFFVTEQATSATEKALRQRQFEALSDADSDYLCSPIAIGEHDNRVYYVLPLCDGTLEQLCRARGVEKVEAGLDDDEHALLFTERELAQIGECVTGGLAYLHAHKGLAHLDIKPSNIMYMDNPDGTRRYLLSDFDVSMDLLQEVQKRTATKGDVEDSVGLGFSPAYAAPEQWSKDYKGEAESDIFAFAVTLYEVAFGKLPVAQGGLGRHLHYNSDEEVPHLFGREGLSEGFYTYLQPCLSRDPGDRPGAKYLQSHFKNYLMTGHWAGFAPKTPEPVSDPGTGSDGRTWLGVAATVMLAVLAGSWFWGGPKLQESYLVRARQHLEEGGAENLKAAGAEIERARKLGALPESGQELSNVPVMSASYSDVKPVKGKTAAVRHPQTGKWGLFDLNEGQELVPCRYDEVIAIEDIGVAIDKTNKRAEIFSNSAQPLKALSGVTFASFSSEGDLLIQRDTLGHSITETITLENLKKAIVPSASINQSN